MTVFSGIFRTARTEGLGVTLHIAEVSFFYRYRPSGRVFFSLRLYQGLRIFYLLMNCIGTLSRRWEIR